MVYGIVGLTSDLSQLRTDTLRNFLYGIKSILNMLGEDTVLPSYLSGASFRDFIETKVGRYSSVGWVSLLLIRHTSSFVLKSERQRERKKYIYTYIYMCAHGVKSGRVAVHVKKNVLFSFPFSFYFLRKGLFRLAKTQSFGGTPPRARETAMKQHAWLSPNIRDLWLVEPGDVETSRSMLL